LKRLASVDRWLEEYAGVGLARIAASLVALACCGVILGVAFPKFEANALLQIPEGRELESRSRLEDRSTVLDLPAYRRAVAANASQKQLQAYIDSRGIAQSDAVRRLVLRSETPSFWDQAMRPILPFSRRDQREFGDLKDASKASSLLGVALTVDAGSEAAAAELAGVFGGFVANALFRERVQAWALAGLAEAVARDKLLQADVVRAELDVGLMEKRITEMRAVLAKYPDAARMDSRQVVNVNPTEGGERFLSPLAQLVGFESAVSQRREKIARSQRELRQNRLLAAYFTEAVARTESVAAVHLLLPALRELGTEHFSRPESQEEWAREAALRVFGSLDAFEVGYRQVDLRDGVRVSEVTLRKPAILALLLGGLGVAIVIGRILVRLSIQSARSASSAA
jgi:hypothetical protein